MRPDTVVTNVQRTVEQILQILSNNLLAAENFAPDGAVGQVLTSRGSRSTPTWQDLPAASSQTTQGAGISGVPAAGQYAIWANALAVSGRTGVPWGDLTSKPTTIAGYGITDFNSLGDARWLGLSAKAADSDLLDGHDSAYFAVAGAAPAAHQLDGALHTVSGLTPGYFLKATGATTFGFAAHGLTYGDVGAAAASHVHTGVYEPVLGNPAADGYILSSTMAGARSWIAAPTGGGTSGYVARWTGSAVLGNGVIRDNGTTVGIGVAPSGNVVVNMEMTLNSGGPDGYGGKLYPFFTSSYTGTVAGLNVAANLIGSVFTVTNVYGIQIGSPSFYNGSGATNLYGLKIEDQTGGGTLNYAIYTGQGLVRLGDHVDLASGKVYKVNNVQVVGAQGATVADATGGVVIDAEARTAINTLLARVRAHGLVAT